MVLWVRKYTALFRDYMLIIFVLSELTSGTQYCRNLFKASGSNWKHLPQREQ